MKDIMFGLKVLTVYILLAVAWETFQMLAKIEFTSWIEPVVILIVTFILVFPYDDK